MGKSLPTPNYQQKPQPFALSSGVKASMVKVCGPFMAGRLRPSRAVGCRLPGRGDSGEFDGEL